MNITHHKNGDIKTLVEEAPYQPGYEDAVPIPFAGWVNASPPHIVDSGASVMNEPVAWIDPRELDMAVSTSVTKHKQFDADIPLYTHPAKTLTEIIEKNKPEIEKVNAYIKSLEDEIEALKAEIVAIEKNVDYWVDKSAKTLTDEEINLLSKAYSTIDGQLNAPAFARAILRKAQEK